MPTPPEPLGPHVGSLKNDKLIRIAASSFHREMVAYGLSEGDVIRVTTEILDLLMKPKDGQARGAGGFPSYEPAYESDSTGAIGKITGPSLALRRLGPQDLPLLATWRDSSAWRNTLLERLFAFSPAELLERFEAGLREFFIVTEADSPAGFLTYERDYLDPSKASMQKFLTMWKRGSGLGTQMTYLWLHYGFHKLGLRKVSAVTADSNLANINLNCKLGFHFEGHLHQEVKLGSGFSDVTVMGILRSVFLDLCRGAAAPDFTGDSGLGS